MADKQLFGGVYCGLCRTLGKRFGLFARMILNYDFVLLAILLSSPETPVYRNCRCPAHRCRKEAVAEPTPALELAATRSVILAWWKLQDGIADSSFFQGLPYRCASWLLRRAYRKARRMAEDFDAFTCQQLAALSELEAAGCTSLDRAADCFAKLLSATATQLPDQRQRRVVEQMLYHLGRWVYLVDAADDLEKDIQKRRYNPLVLRFALTNGQLDGEAKQLLAQTLDASLRTIAAAYELWDFGVWSGILEGMVYDSLYQVGGSVLSGNFRHGPRKVDLKVKRKRYE